MKDTIHVDDPPTVLSHDGFVFTIHKRIGEGGFARCYEAIEASSTKKFAIKAIHTDAILRMKARSKLLNELDIHCKLDHRHIVKFYKVFQDCSFVYMVLELCENRTMVDLLKSRRHLSEAESRHFLWMIILAIHYMHERNIIHRDLKLSNIFLNLEYDIKIGDFGLATTLEDLGERKKTICGTPNYIAPEILFDKERGHSFEVDIWAFGVIMYSLLFGRPPFQSSDVKAIYQNIKDNAYSFPETIPVSTSAKDLISSILTHDPDKRPKLDTIASHPFFQHVLIKEPTSFEIHAIKSYFQQLSITSSHNGSRSTENIAANNVTLNQGNRVLTPGREKRSNIVELVYHSLSKFFRSKQNSQIHNNNLIAATTAALSATLTLNPLNIAMGSNHLADTMHSSAKPPLFYIEKWIDYTSKYGIGYRGNNGHIGAYFNDATCVILNPETGIFEYQSPSISESADPSKASASNATSHDNPRSIQSKQIIRQKYSVEDYPNALNKKITILKHFQSYLKGGVKPQTMEHSNANSGICPDCLIKYAKINGTFIFRLSNRVIQAVFPDQTIVVLSQEGQVVTIILKDEFSSDIHDQRNGIEDIVIDDDENQRMIKVSYFLSELEPLSTFNNSNSNNQIQQRHRIILDQKLFLLMGMLETLLKGSNMNSMALRNDAIAIPNVISNS
jgi:serine/threonine protein kinase